MRTMSAAMPVKLVLPRGVADLVGRTDVSDRHPGLQLDKLSPPGDQKAQRRAIDDVCAAARGEALLRDLSSRRAAVLDGLRARRFQATTAGPLTLHLARASGLENAGIHLHPVYGFVCLPGSGLKGMARAWAETIWLEGQDDPAAAWGRIRAVFGWTPATDARKSWQPDGVQAPAGSRAGAVVFHDAWPTTWPRLEPDIVNNHHAQYYEGQGDPGDWEDPVPVYFLTVPAGATFDFAVSPRPGADDAGVRLAELALEWLRGALAHEGAGAKTNAGYGRFRLKDVPDPPAPARRIARHALALATPAFLAGAQQQGGDCDLRPATLRGLLRWWWRTMHAAHLDRTALRKLETVVWGDAENGGALAVSVEGAVRPVVKPFDFKDGFRPKPEFARAHDLERPSSKATQGLFYAAYGMDEKSKGQVRRRHYAAPGARWTVTLKARKGRLPDGGRRIEAADVLGQGGGGADRGGGGARGRIEAADVLGQGEAALWLLCRYGGVGSKARKGFGSFADVEVAGIAAVDDCKRRAAAFRRTAGVAERAGAPAGSSSLEDMLDLEVETPWKDWWFAIDQLGSAAQAFARENAHQDDKAALGLPRQIHGPRNQPMGHQDRGKHKPPKRLSARNGQRHAAPVHYHLSPRADGALTIRMTAFPSPALPDIGTSRRVLGDLRAWLQTGLMERKERHADRGIRAPKPDGVPPGPDTDTPAAASAPPKSGERVDAVLLDEKTKKGGWKARHEPSGLQGPIQNTADVPGDAAPGNRVGLVVASVNPREIAFRWPTARDAGPKNPGRPSRQGPGSRPRRGGGG